LLENVTIKKLNSENMIKSSLLLLMFFFHCGQQFDNCLFIYFCLKNCFLYSCDSCSVQMAL